MQKQLLLFFTGALFILLTGFKRDNLTSSSKASPGKGPVTITAVFDFSTFPDVIGTFTTSGALNVSGTAEMVVGPNENGVRAHCVVILLSLIHISEPTRLL